MATAELKNPLTGQTVEHAIAQYRTDRDPANRTLSKRAVVHFAVDTESVAMTTRLAGESTRFLPFNLGHERRARATRRTRTGTAPRTCGSGCGSATPGSICSPGSSTSSKPSEGLEGAGAGDLPALPPVGRRAARWRRHARVEGPGRSYLVQHSAGSGKSNTIAWLAHRLSTLHDATDHKVFDKVIVITDRVVLDRQLQDTIYQFEHAHGVVEQIDEDSQQLADALAGEQARIIITTLQKFPFVLDKVDGLPDRAPTR